MVRLPNQQIRDFLVGDDHPLGGLALCLRTIVHDEVPSTVEVVFRNHPTAVWFGFGPKMRDMFCYIARASTHVNLGFCQGASLKDPENVFEGVGKVMRHIKIRNEQDLAQRFVRTYIRAAAKEHGRPQRIIHPKTKRARSATK